jgi:NCAIR mutase (PurE)-related protein
MNERQLQRLMEQVRSGKVSACDAVQRLKTLPFEDLEFAKLDTHRELRTGFPEVVFCRGKTPTQVAAIMERLAAKGPVALATHATPEVFATVLTRVPDAEYRDVARIVVVRRGPKLRARGGQILVISAGTADIPVAEEAVVTATEMGARIDRLYDVGVAGLHRLLTHRDRLTTAKVIIVVAGMEGALPSVIGGLVEAPVIAVPTSIGYGASFQGLAALLTMLNSCATGVAVVNIDNGFGAGYLAAMIARQARA